jgi:uncharacterized linocin/CFP29 family protein
MKNKAERQAIERLVQETWMRVEHLNEIAKSHPELVIQFARKQIVWPGFISRKRAFQKENAKLMDKIELGRNSNYSDRGQMSEDGSGRTRTGLTLAKLAAKSLALAEDILIFQGERVDLPPGVSLKAGKDSAGNGLLGLVSDANTMKVKRSDSNSGGEILAAITQGIANLTAKAQAEPFALILDTNAYAATWGSVINGTPTYTVLTPVLTGGIYGTPSMPADTGLLVATGGEPITIYFSSDPMTEIKQKDEDGKYLFREYERIQFVARDARALVRLNFPQASTAKES